MERFQPKVGRSVCNPSQTQLYMLVTARVGSESTSLGGLGLLHRQHWVDLSCALCVLWRIPIFQRDADGGLACGTYAARILVDLS